VGEMSLRMQALLLRFLESGEIQAVGAETRQATVNVRVIAATNRHLSEMVSAGQFRADLLYRLRVIHLHVPPLRDRKDEVRPLALAFIKTFGREVTLVDEVWHAFEQYQWPGNVRELQNVIEQIVALAQSGVPVSLSQIPVPVRSGTQAVPPGRERRRQVSDELYEATRTCPWLTDRTPMVVPLLLRRAHLLQRNIHAEDALPAAILTGVADAFEGVRRVPEHALPPLRSE